MKVTEMFDLTGKNAIITGGYKGLGAQMSTALAEAGANLVVAARRVQACEEMCAQIKQELGIKAIPVQCDVSNPEDCQFLVEKACREMGTIDILVNNAGFTWGADSLDYPMDKWQKVLNINLTGVFQLSAIAARVMKKQGRGKIVNITSVAGFGGTAPEMQDTVAYNASKGAIITLTKDLAVKWARYGIYVNALAPAYFPTKMSAKLMEKNRDLVMPRLPLQRFGNEQDLKGAIVFFCSPASDYITGVCLAVDGGMTALL